MIKSKLDYAEKIAAELFESIQKKDLISSGKTEAELSLEICNIATTEFGITDYWHKKIVRTGKNTMCSYTDNPSNLVIQKNDIVILDFGPIVNDYEADFGRTYIVGNNPSKIKLKQSVELAWYEIRSWYNIQSNIKASDLFNYCVIKASEYGYVFGGEIAGHIVGKYPHEQPLNPSSLELDIHPSNHTDMHLLDGDGNKRFWILELLFIDRENNIGSFFEQLL